MPAPVNSNVMRMEIEKSHVRILTWLASIVGALVVVSCLAWGVSWLVFSPVSDSLDLPEKNKSEKSEELLESETQTSSNALLCANLKSDFKDLMRDMPNCGEDSDCTIIENKMGLMDLGGHQFYSCIVSTHKSSSELVQSAVDDWAQCSRVSSSCTFVPNGRHGTGGIALCQSGVCGYEPIPRISLEALQEQTKRDISEP